MKAPDSLDDILMDYLSTQRQRQEALEYTSPLAPHDRKALTHLAFEQALHRHGSSTIAGVAFKDVVVEKDAPRICPITFEHGWRVEDARLLSPSAHNELLTLWAKKIRLLPFEEDKQDAALNTLANVQPIEGGLRRFLDADDAVILPTKEVLRKLAPILEQRVAKELLSGREGWNLDIDFHTEPLLLLHCAKIPIADDSDGGTASNCSDHQEKRRWALAHEFQYVALRRDKGLQPSVTSHWNQGHSDEHHFHPHGQHWPTDVVPLLPTFPSFLSLAAAIGVYIFRVKAVRRIEGWGGHFEPHHDLALYVAHLLCASSRASFRRALKLRPLNLPGKHADVQAFERLTEANRDEDVTRGFARWAVDGDASNKAAKEGQETKRKSSAHKKQGLAERKEGEGSRNKRQRRNASPVERARLSFEGAATRLDVALEELFDQRRLSLLDLLLGWQAVNAAVGADKARELLALRLAKHDAYEALRKAVRGENKDEEGAAGHDLRAATPVTSCASSSRASSSSSSPEGLSSSGKSWTCLTGASGDDQETSDS